VASLNLLVLLAFNALKTIDASERGVQHLRTRTRPCRDSPSLTGANEWRRIGDRDCPFPDLFGQLSWPPFWTEEGEAGRGGVHSVNRDQPGPQNQRAAMSDKSPRQTMTKKSGKSLKEKRAAKRTKEAQISQTEALLHTKKR
jgi:hypothetical protein